MMKHCVPIDLIRSVAPKSHKLLTSLQEGRLQVQPRVILRFDTTEGIEEVDNWYLNQPTKKFTKIEYRKFVDGFAKHEFIVVWLQNSRLICRFDRRATEKKGGQALDAAGTESEDSAHTLNPGEPVYKEVMDDTEVLLTIDFPEGEDLRVILAVCRGIQDHPDAKSYSLLVFNCYFFTWAIISSVARRGYNWEKTTASEEVWNNIIQESLKSISTNRSRSGSTEITLNNSSKQPKRNRDQFRDRFAAGGGKKKPKPVLPPPSVVHDESSAKHFRDALEYQLTGYRPFITNTLRRLLLRSQLAPVLNREMRRHFNIALLDAKIMAAEGNAAATSMRHVSDARVKPKEPTKYGEITWLNHCNIAWEVAIEAAYAAAIVTAKEENNPDGEELKTEIDPTSPAPWEQEWDRAWGEHWAARIPANDLTSDNRELGESTTFRGKQAWIQSWETSTEIGKRHVSDIAQRAADVLIDRLIDLDPSRLTFNEKSKVSG